jgi:3-demethoxyubiquinol 3-hydroxylase
VLYHHIPHSAAETIFAKKSKLKVSGSGYHFETLLKENITSKITPAHDASQEEEEEVLISTMMKRSVAVMRQGGMSFSWHASSVSSYLSTSSTVPSSSSVDAQAELQSIPPWLLSEMRTNHAGEYGAVQIYTGAYYGLKFHEQLNIFIDDKREAMKIALEFVNKHKGAEQNHLNIIESFIAKKDRTNLIPIWHISGFMLGLVPSIFGPRALYWTVASVETFVEEHYNHQINRLIREGDNVPNIRKTLQLCCEDEIEHKDEAIAALLLGVEGDLRNTYEDETLYDDLLQKSALIRAWTYIVDTGSRIAVKISKKY